MMKVLPVIVICAGPARHWSENHYFRVEKNPNVAHCGARHDAEEAFAHVLGMTTKGQTVRCGCGALRSNQEASSQVASALPKMVQPVFAADFQRAVACADMRVSITMVSRLDDLPGHMKGS
jgi:hypothetical protein